jgi:ribosomal protein S18 acetylase RimI-like enzyme
MTVTLRPVPPERMPAWIQRSADEYARDLVSLGQPPADAQRVAEAGMAESFPTGRPRPGHAVLDVLDAAGEPVGYLWIGPETDAQAGGDAWWVWDVVIDEQRRGEGLGRAAMLLAEDHAAAHGARTLGLSVFGFNLAARRLYESLGYGTTSVKMSKLLHPADRLE